MEPPRLVVEALPTGVAPVSRMSAEELTRLRVARERAGWPSR